MLRKVRSNLTYANVMATMAVFIALGGSSYAAFKVTTKNVPKDALTGADIKNLTGKDVKNNTLDGRDVKNLKAADFTGTLPAGPQGLQGLKGDKGDAGATDVIVRSKSELDGSATILCEAGETVTGGGAYANTTGSHVVSSNPYSFSTGTGALGWQATTNATDTSVYVLCARP